MNLLWSLNDTRVRFCWVPSHCGIDGNERVDQLAKETLYQDIDPLASVHYTDMKPLVNSYIKKLVQTKWDVAVHGRDLYLVKPTLGPPKKFQHLTRAEEVVITRLRIGHTSARKLSTSSEWLLTWNGEGTDTLLMLYRAIVRSKLDYGCIVYGTASNTNLRQLDSIHNSGLSLALGAFCTSPVSSLYTEANEAPLEERRLKLSMHYHVKTRACIDNPGHHALHEFDRTTRDLYTPRLNGRGGMTRTPVPPIGLKVEESMTSAEINAELVCPLRTPNFPPGTHDYDPKRHNLIEGVSKCMISGQKAQAKFNEFREAQGSHDEVYTDGSKMNESGGSGGHQPPFPEWWDNLPPSVQKTARQRHHLCRWGYSHQPGTELLPTHGPSPSWCGSLLWLNVLFAGTWGWRHREPFHLPYHEPALVIEWQGHTCSFFAGYQATVALTEMKEWTN